MNIQADPQGRPVIRYVSAKLQSIEHRMQHLETNIRLRRGSPGALEYDKRELEALEAAKVALTYHRATIEGLDEPLGLLGQLVEAYNGPVGEERRLKLLMQRAAELLKEYGQAG